MILVISNEILKAIHQHGEEAYPEEGAGLLLGKAQGEAKRVAKILPLANTREDAARHNRYLLTRRSTCAGRWKPTGWGWMSWGCSIRILTTLTAPPSLTVNGLCPGFHT